MRENTTHPQVASLPGWRHIAHNPRYVKLEGNRTPAVLSPVFRPASTGDDFYFFLVGIGGSDPIQVQALSNQPDSSSVSASNSGGTDE